MKKIISLLLAAVLVVGLTPVLAAEPDRALPQKGEVVSGFRMEEIQDCDMLGGKTALFAHEKTGAKLLYIQNRDTNRYFSIGFRTPGVDDTGVNHVLEHCTVSGSEKYPFNNILFSLLNQTYSTFVNAMTHQCYTWYPCASTSEAQLRKLMDVYLNCAFYPSVYEDEKIFQREAVRYNLEAPDAPLEMTGTVYNEMKGAYDNINSFAYGMVNRVLFPTTEYRYQTGGTPENIPSLTWKQTVDTHTAYYHPSNSLTVVYGDLDYRTFLKDIDENYFSKFEKKAGLPETKAEPDFSAPQDVVFDFPVSKDTPAENGAVLNYAVRLGRQTVQSMTDAVMLSALLMDQSSPLYTGYRKAGFGGTLSVGMNTDIPYPVIMISANNVNEEKKEQFRGFVEETLRQISETGFSEALIDAVITAERMSEAMMLESTSTGLSAASIAMTGWSNYGDVNLLNSMFQRIEGYNATALNQLLKKSIKENILDNQNKAMVSVVPKPGLLEEQEEARTKALADKKAAMTQEQAAELVKQTQEYDQWIARPEIGDPSKLQAITVAELPEEFTQVQLKEEKEDGLRMITGAAETGTLTAAQLYFDTSGIPKETLYAYALAAQLIGRTGTQNASAEQINIDITKYLSNFQVSPSCLTAKDGTWRPVLNVSWFTLRDELEHSVQLVEDVLMNSDFSDQELLRQVIADGKAAFQQQLSSGAFNMIIQRNISSYMPAANYMRYLSGEEFYQFLLDTEKLLDSDPQQVAQGLKQAWSMAVRKNGIVGVSVDKEQEIAASSEKLRNLCASFPDNPLEAQDYSAIPAPAKKEGVVLDANVNYNILGANPRAYGIENYGRYQPICLYVQDQYLLPQLRFSGGAYGAYMAMSPSQLAVYTYRDPQVGKSFDIMRGIPEFLENSSLTQQDLNQYILKAYSDYTTPRGPISTAMLQIEQYLTGYSQEDIKGILADIKGTTVQDVKQSAGVIGRMLDEAYVTSGANEETLQRDKAYFDEIIRLTPAEQVITRRRFAEMMFGTGNPMKAAIESGLYLGDGAGGYFEDKAVSREELAVFVSRLADLSALPEGTHQEISDLETVSVWAREAVQHLVNAGFMTLENGAFQPFEAVTGQEIQTLLSAVTQNLQAMREAA